ncbi:uncharacterized protein CTRU02_215640 [Colletotrichum truncatum]|uniref:Uncharacterized protein n=1 Tax=Colletotrichum truncatum TaxID=5467 RepID=A0ACC3YCA6_COLTU|nr:uncharacterized protein CTRU02_05421 [Colletotrichum truncatum]KAF6793864.1 hypothetical protein CTRU02_05421 [Colletotrichum truncatum]
MPYLIDIPYRPRNANYNVLDAVDAEILEKEGAFFNFDTLPAGRIKRRPSGRYYYVKPALDRWFVTPLGYAAALGQFEAVVSLLHQKEDVDGQHPEGASTALTLALFGGHEKVAKLLLDKGAQPDASLGYNALHAAARMGFNDIITILIDDYGVDPNVEDLDGTTPIGYACPGR